YFWDADLMAREKALRYEISEYLVRQGADIDVENIFRCKPIDLAIFHGYEGTVQLLKSEGGQPGLFGAAYLGDLDRIKELLEEGVDIDLKGRYRRTAFAEAHLRGHFAVEAFLVQQGCSREIP
ncbi:GORK, partial [Symbiodinium pilosum]